MTTTKQSKYAILIKSDSATDFVEAIEMFSKQYPNLTVSKIVTPDTKRDIDEEQKHRGVFLDEIYDHYGIVFEKP